MSFHPQQSTNSRPTRQHPPQRPAGNRRDQIRHSTWLRVLLSIAIIIAVIVGAYIAYTEGEDGFSFGQDPARNPAAGIPEDEALDQIVAWHSGLEVAASDPQEGYDRGLFGSAWADDSDTVFGGNGCDTRNDILMRDLTEVTFRDDDGCTIATGVLDDPYTGERIEFTRGAATSGAVQIDHVVALSNAWKTGGRHLDDVDLRNIANDPLNLLASDGPANMGKGDKDAAEWLPQNEAFHCQYVARQIAVKERYHLWATPEEHGAMGQALSTCGEADLPALARIVEGREAGRE